mmetsp:Transcript_23794/g.60119  ORF Transcript_23794/g.60119 Transcript_23794/m.60119 type:complete len:523 (+) Transcript_23794:230-1798(+)|eukprot:CAMPEP_0178992662 /NCGR_PEP_ID=MMETSP0795-20121207/6245_1 /TAXON_ID=88552 /ORGANISM="Amoebophrya sp., Strain Ameob2" /LENGTH=522 /DNA_ID=CAMNT_0020684581 /DNA_START=217 /DNA_END=1785 /DNA_ORIENTATION=-
MGLCLFREEENDARIVKLADLKKRFQAVLGSRENLTQECRFLWSQILRSGHTTGPGGGGPGHIDKGDVMSCTQKFIDQIDGGDEESLSAIDLLINGLPERIGYELFLTYVRDVMHVLDAELHRRYEHALDAHGSLCGSAYQETTTFENPHYCYHARNQHREPFHAAHFVPTVGVGMQMQFGASFAAPSGGSRIAGGKGQHEHYSAAASSSSTSNPGFYRGPSGPLAPVPEADSSNSPPARRPVVTFAYQTNSPSPNDSYPPGYPGQQSQGGFVPSQSSIPPTAVGHPRQDLTGTFDSLPETRHIQPILKQGTSVASDRDNYLPPEVTPQNGPNNGGIMFNRVDPSDAVYNQQNPPQQVVGAATMIAAPAAAPASSSSKLVAQQGPALLESVEQVRDALLEGGVLMQVFNSDYDLEWKYIRFDRGAGENVAPNQIHLIGSADNSGSVMRFMLAELERVERGPNCLGLSEEIAEAAATHKVDDAEHRLAAFIFGQDGFLILVFPDRQLAELSFKAFKTFGIQVG